MNLDIAIAGRRNAAGAIMVRTATAPQVQHADDRKDQDLTDHGKEVLSEMSAGQALLALAMGRRLRGVDAVVGVPFAPHIGPEFRVCGGKDGKTDSGPEQGQGDYNRIEHCCTPSGDITPNLSQVVRSTSACNP